MHRSKEYTAAKIAEGMGRGDPDPVLSVLAYQKFGSTLNDNFQSVLLNGSVLLFITKHNLGLVAWGATAAPSGML